MRRKEETYLVNWYQNPNRKPLLIRGARQVGKSTLVRLFCQRNDLPLVEVNFEQTYALTQLFSTNDPKEIIKTLEVLHNTRIEVAKTVLFLDEIQANPEAIRSLRYFFFPHHPTKLP